MQVTYNTQQYYYCYQDYYVIIYNLQTLEGYGVYFQNVLLFVVIYLELI